MPLLALGLVTGGALAYEILLTRLLAVVHWHHFVGMVVSMALLGYGVAGSAVAVLADRLKPRARGAFALGAALFGLAAPAAFLVAQRLPFNALELLWDPRQLLWLLLLYLTLAVPFVFAAACTSLWLAFLDRPIGRIYRADLIGAGAGAVGVVLLLALVPLPLALRAVGALGPMAAALVLARDRRVPALALLLLGIALVALPPAQSPALAISPYKGLSQTLAIPGTRVVAERSGPLGLLTVVRSERIPFRQVPGLSLSNLQEPAEQLGLFVDGEGPTPITAGTELGARLAYLDRTLSALPYHLLADPRVLVLGLGGGTEVLLALHEGAAAVDVVEPNAQLVDLLRRELRDFTGALLDHPRVAVRIAEPRQFVAAGDGRWDLIVLPMLESSAGATSLRETFAYTVEAFAGYLERLSENGLIAVEHWLRLPPRYSLKLFLTASEALARRGAAAPERHLLLLRGWDTVVLLAAGNPLPDAALARARRFAEERGFDLVWPAAAADGSERPFHQLAEPYFEEAFAALAGPRREDFLRDYRFDVRPATDDRPYFFDFFRWRALPDLWSAPRQGTTALLDWGYPVQLAAVLQAALVGLVLIVLPLRRKLRAVTPPRRRYGVVAYFLAIGVAFMFVEIGTIQQLVLVLGHPTYATAVALAGFLVFAGLGSGLAPRLAQRFEGRAVGVAVLAVAALTVLLLLALPVLGRLLALLPDAVRVLGALALIAPLALFMGMPFPLVLGRVRETSPALVPWAFAVNGCASVVAALLAALLAVAIGVTAVMALAILLYALAAVVARRGFGT